MVRKPASKLMKRLFVAMLALALIMAVGTAGYHLLAGPGHSLFDCLYMTFVTLTTIGFSEIIDLSKNPAGRVFTMLLGLVGIGTVTYMLSSLTAFIVEGELSEAFRRKNMEKMAKNLTDHYIVCGVGQVGFHIAHELRATGRPFVVIDANTANLQHVAEAFPDAIYLEGDATDNDVLLLAGVTRGRGIFAATHDDNQNLVIALSARQLNKDITVVTRCSDLKNVEKMKAAGASNVISPAFIGALRMASEMIRPTVVSFLDTMLRDKEKNLRVEEVPASWPGRRIADLQLERFRNTLLLAVRMKAGWIYNPPPDRVLAADDVLVVMTTPQERAELEKHILNRP